MALQGGHRKSGCLLNGFSFLTYKRSPFSNNRASRVRLGHLDLLFEKAVAGRLATGLGVPPPPPFPPGDSVLRCLLERSGLPQSRRECSAALMHGALLDDVAALLQ